MLLGYIQDNESADPDFLRTNQLCHDISIPSPHKLQIAVLSCPYSAAGPEPALCDSS